MRIFALAVHTCTVFSWWGSPVSNNGAFFVPSVTHLFHPWIILEKFEVEDKHPLLSEINNKKIWVSASIQNPSLAIRRGIMQKTPEKEIIYRNKTLFRLNIS